MGLWVELEPAAVEVDGCLEVLSIAVTADGSGNPRKRGGMHHEVGACQIRDT